MSEEPNSYEQKKKFHAMIRDIARQVPFAGEMIDEAEWKLFIFAGFYGQDVVQNPFYDASDPMMPAFIIRNRKRTRDLEKSGDKSMADLITQLLAFGDGKQVQWSDPEWIAYLKQCEVRT